MRYFTAPAAGEVIGERSKNGNQLGAAGGVAERRQRERRVAPHHRLRVMDQPQERVVEGRVIPVLAHDPGGGLAQLDGRAGGEADHARIPARDILTLRDPFADLNQRVLRVAGFRGIGKVLIDIRVGELAAEPGVVPEEKREQHQQDGEEGNEEIGFFAGTPGSGHDSKSAARGTRVSGFSVRNSWTCCMPSEVQRKALRV